MLGCSMDQIWRELNLDYEKRSTAFKFYRTIQNGYPIWHRTITEIKLGHVPRVIYKNVTSIGSRAETRIP
eukprot:UN10298